MKGKSKIAMLLLIITFVVTAGMFYYQNVYMKNEDKKNQVMVLVAKSNISKGSTFSTDNVGAIKMDKSMVSGQYFFNFSDLKGKYANSDMYPSEIITKARIDNGDTDKDGTSTLASDRKFDVEVKPKNIPSGLQQGDEIRVYVQSSVTNQVFELFDQKQITSVSYKKDSTGKSNGAIDAIHLLVSNKESIELLEASKVGDILLVKYNDLHAKDLVNAPKYEDYSNALMTLVSKAKYVKPENSPILLTEKDKNVQSGNEASNTTDVTKSDAVQTPSVAQSNNAQESVTNSYIVAQGDTFDNVAKKTGLTVDEIKALNPGVTKLTPGDKLNVQKQ